MPGIAKEAPGTVCSQRDIDGMVSLITATPDAARSRAHDDRREPCRVRTGDTLTKAEPHLVDAGRTKWCCAEARMQDAGRRQVALVSDSPNAKSWRS